MSLKCSLFFLYIFNSLFPTLAPAITYGMLEFVLRQIDRDCEFLEAERIMDYSLLVGLHFRDDNTCDKMGLSPFFLRSGNLIIFSFHCNCLMLYEPCGTENDGLNLSFSGKRDSYQNEKFMRGCRFLQAELQDMDRILAGRYVL